MIRVLYTCGRCHVKDQEVAIEERAPDSDIVRWMRQTVGVSIGMDHSFRSPRCFAPKMEQVRIPLDKIGGATT